MTTPVIDTFPLSSPHRKKIERAFGLGQFRRVDYKPVGKLGMCYWTVDNLVREHGGKAIVGWQILWWPSLLVEGMHHAIWQTPDGVMTDVTQKSSSDHRNFTTFVIDDSLPMPLDQPKFIPNKYYLLSKNPLVAELVDAQVAFLDAKRSSAQKALSIGAAWDRERGIVADADVMKQLVSEAAEMRKLDEKVRALYSECRKLTK